jgi:hypothetical protein
MRSGCLPLYSDVKELNATAFAIPSYIGGSLGRVAIYRYIYGNMGFSDFCKGVIDERVVRVTADGAEEQRGPGVLN